MLIEEPLFFGNDRQYPKRLHKQKIILHRASMQRYAKEVLWPAGFDVEYFDLDILYATSDVLERAKKFDQIYVIDPVEDILTHRLLEARRERPDSPEIQFLPSPNFYLNEKDAREYFTEKHKNLFGEFYQWQRERFNILIGDDYKPLGGEWMLSKEANDVAPKTDALPSFEVFGDNEYVQEAVEFVEENFAGNPGGTDFIWPTGHTEATQWLDDFIANRLEHFADYKDKFDGQAAWLYHSALSSSLNIGLLSPRQVVEAVVLHSGKRNIPLESQEAFIRNVLGWREFVRGNYITKNVPMRRSNVFKQHRKLTGAWYTGDLGIPPYDDLVHKVATHAYAHNSERLAVIGNLMTLAEIDPEQIYQWFSEMFIDAYDWAVVPNVYGLTQFVSKDAWAEGSGFSASNTILKLGDYERGTWSDVWDGLFWRFVEKHHSLLSHDSQTRVLVHRLERLDPDRKRIIGYRAEDFLSRYTLL